MRKRLIVLFFLLSSACVYAQTADGDTLFLYRWNGEYYNAIFKDTTRSSEYYDWIVQNKGNAWDSAEYKERLATLKKHTRLKSFNTLLLPTDWRPLYVYKNQFYIYSPSDWGANSWVHIRDSVLTEYIFGDGTTPNAILSFKQIAPRQFEIKSISPWKTLTTVRIHVIDEEKGIAVFEDSRWPANDKYFLMVAADKVKNFPIIVNYCPTDRVAEFEFDKPDFEKLLRLKK